MSLNLNNLETIKENLKIYPKSNLLIVTKNQSIEDIRTLYSMAISYLEKIESKKQQKNTKISHPNT